MRESADMEGIGQRIASRAGAGVRSNLQPSHRFTEDRKHLNHWPYAVSQLWFWSRVVAFGRGCAQVCAQGFVAVFKFQFLGPYVLPPRDHGVAVSTVSEVHEGHSRRPGRTGGLAPCSRTFACR